MIAAHGLLRNMREIGKKCMSYKVQYVFISNLTFNTRISHKLLNEVNKMIERVCLENDYYYIGNGNVCENDLFKDGYIYKILVKRFYLRISL